ncbi:Centromere protein K [Collichthys lucidus]|uniref:Centromere protein K n=1 Tax=Collichthys lucidus TaxID=240159 RepID=A0A4U5U5Z1_COLLU|nr:Centromere protein K [Collichthys lucidus]
MAEVKPGGAAAAEVSEAAENEVIDMCEDQFALLEKLQNEILLSERDFCENPQEQMVKLCSELEMVVSCYEAKRDKLRETKELEQKWLEEKREALMAACEHAKRLKMAKGKISELSVLQDTKAKIQKMKVYQESLMECLGDILEKHVPFPQNDSSTNKKKKNIAQESDEDLISLNEILELLMNQVLKTPHDPYVTIDNTFWPPYIEMLLRYGLAVRHQENNFKIRLETFC